MNNKYRSEVAMLNRDKLRLMDEADSLRVAKSKLEELCRALQLRNKEIVVSAVRNDVSGILSV
jgi:hypothetical protein